MADEGHRQSRWSATLSVSSKVGCAAQAPASSVRVFCYGGARPPVRDMIDCNDHHREHYGVEPRGSPRAD